MAGSTTSQFTRGAPVPTADKGSCITPFTRGASISARGSSIFPSLRDTPVITNGLIRGPQFRPNTIDSDRFSNRLTSVLSTVYIDLTITGTTALYTIPAGNIAVINGIVLRSTQETAITDATISCGINPSTTNLFDEQQLVQFRSINDVWSLWSDKSTTLIAQAGEQIDLDVTIAATGGSLEAQAYLIGFLI